jgi:hypothetical protein
MCGRALWPAHPTIATTGAFGVVWLCASVRALDEPTTSAIVALAPILPVLPILPIQVTFCVSGCGSS